MIAGTLVMEDSLVHFRTEEDVAYVTVSDRPTGQLESYTCAASDLSKALAIALHWDGTPNAAEDYPAAERAQGKIRWIP